jgi:flagellar basal body L-ring protein FlgH
MFLMMSMLLIFIYFCGFFFGDVGHVMSNMDIPKKHSTEIYKDEQHGHHQKKTTQKYIKMSNMDITKKHSTEIYKDERVLFLGDVHVAHLYIFLCFVFW